MTIEEKFTDITEMHRRGCELLSKGFTNVYPTDELIKQNISFIFMDDFLDKDKRDIHHLSISMMDFYSSTTNEFSFSQKRTILEKYIKLSYEEK